MASSNVAKLPKTRVIVGSHCFQNGNNDHKYRKRPYVTFPDVRYWVEHIDIIKNKMEVQRSLVSQTVLFLCTLTQTETGKVYVGIYTPYQFINESIYQQMLCNCGPSDACLMTLELYLKILVVEMKVVVVTQSTDNIIRLAKVISHILVIAG